MANQKISLDSVKYKSFEDFYNSIDEKGSLGLLAYGAKGVLAWKKKKKELNAKKGKGTNEDKL